MLTLAEPASRRSARRFTRNLRALRDAQPDVADLLIEPDHGWRVVADGSLVADDEPCSVPRDAADRLQGHLIMQRDVVCLAHPRTAHHVRAPLDHLRPGQCLVALFPTPETLATCLGTLDFTGDLDHGRLVVLAGDGWTRQLEAVYASRPGMSVGAEFLHHAGLTEAQVAPLAAAATPVLRRAAAETTRRVADARAANPRPGHVLGLGASAFHPTRRAARVVHDLFGGPDADRPHEATPAAVALASAGARAVVAPDRTRRHLGDAVEPSCAVVTWATRGVPARDGALPTDRLVVADPALLDAARAAGWVAAVGGFPETASAGSGEGILLVADLPHEPPHVVPGAVASYSAQVPLWRSIERELSADASPAVADPAAYLLARRDAAGLDRVDAGPFLARLIWPLVLRHAAKTLAAAGHAVTALGGGWDGVAGVGSVAAPCRDEHDLHGLARNHRLVVDGSPDRVRGPLHALGLPAAFVTPDLANVADTTEPPAPIPAIGRAMVETLLGTQN